MLSKNIKKESDKYKLNGKVVPGVTTILRQFQFPEPLINWAYKCGVEGKNIYEIKNEATSIGKIFHDSILSYYTNENFIFKPPENIPAKQKEILNRLFDSFVNWEKSSGFKFIHGEVPFVCLLHGFGGTIDCIGTIDNKPVILDWKTSNRLSDEYCIQIAAYIYLLRMGHYVGEGRLDIDRDFRDNVSGMLVRFDKNKPIRPVVKEINEREFIKYLNVFISLVNAYYWLKRR